MAAKYPEPISALLKILADRHFEIVRENYGSMNGVELVLSGTGQRLTSTVWVEITGDRGHWSIRVRFDDLTPWTTPAVWEAHLDGTDIRPPNVVADAHFVESRLDEAAQEAALHPELEIELERAGREYMRRRFGLPPGRP